MKEAEIKDIAGLQVWFQRYKDFALQYLKRLNETSTGEAAAFQDEVMAILDLLPADFGNKTIVELATEYNDVI